MENIINRYMLSDGRRLSIGYDDEPYNPREDDNMGKLCLREHRRYKFPNELDFDFNIENENDDDESIEALEKNYWMFRLDCYEHSWISFSLSWQGMQCRFDTSNNCGFIAIPKTWDWKVFDISENEAKNIAEQEIKIYNQYLNWEVYRRITEKPVKRTSEDGQEKIEREFEDGCWWYYDEKDILDEFKVLNPNEIE